MARTLEDKSIWEDSNELGEEVMRMSTNEIVSRTCLMDNEISGKTTLWVIFTVDMELMSKLDFKTAKNYFGALNAYVVVKIKETAEKAVSLNGVEFKGHHLRIKLASKSPQNCEKEEFKGTVFVGNLNKC